MLPFVSFYSGHRWLYNLPKCIGYPQLLWKSITDGVNGEPRTGDETRPVTAVYPVMIKLYGTVTEGGSANIAALIQAVTGKLDTARFDISQQVLHVQDQKPTGTEGGTFTLGAARQRDLNTVLTNTINATVADNTITLHSPGVYFIEARAPFYGVYWNKAWLSMMDDTVVLDGTSEYGDVGATSGASCIRGRFQISTETTLKINHQSNRTMATSGFGTRASIPGHPEVFTDVIIRRIS